MVSKTPSVLIIESMDADDPGSEGRFVKHMLDLMSITSHYHKARTSAEFLRLLSSGSSNSDLIYITTHGEYEKIGPKKRKKFTGFWTPKGIVTLEHLEAENIDLSGKTVISTACFSGQKLVGERFRDATDCKYYIAPRRGPHFHNAPLTCHLFYHKHLVPKRSVKKAFSEYDDRYKNPHDFRIV